MADLKISDLPKGTLEEKIARAMCEAEGLDPDKEVLDDNSMYAPRWQRFLPEAKRFLAAHRVLWEEHQ